MQEDASSGTEGETPTASAKPDIASRETTMKASGERFYQIPVVRVRESKDGPELVEDQNGPHWLSESYIRRTYGIAPARLREFQVTGNTMENTIRSGDWVLVGMWNRDCLVDGAVCLIRGPSGLLIRRIRLCGPMVVLAADNTSVPDLEIKREQWNHEYEPLGSILAVMRRM